jgi:tripartite-type tricarboxylate transporter receptor subunit TctC
MNFMYSFNRGQVLIAAMAAGALGLISGSLQAQGDASSYPTQSARIIVPYPPGGGADFLARLLAEKAQTKWGQTMIVENRSGAGGNVGTEFVFRSSPDGYTMLFTAQPPLVANKSLYKKLNFDPDLMAPAAVMATGYSVLVVPPRLPVNTVQEFIALARANPGKLNYASQGIGNAAHLAAELFSTMAGIKMTHIPYKGTAPALADTLAGQVDVLFGELATAGTHVKAGKLKLLGVGGLKRLPEYPNVPSISEVLPKFQATVWQGMVGPPATPAAVGRKWASLITEVVSQSDVMKRLQDMSMIPGGGTPEDMAQFMKEDRERWAAVIKASGATAE